MDENSSVLPLSDASMERGPGGEVYFRRRKGKVKAFSYTKNRVFELSK
jgi:hypothetical protein